MGHHDDADVASASTDLGTVERSSRSALVFVAAAVLGVAMLAAALVALDRTSPDGDVDVAVDDSAPTTVAVSVAPAPPLPDGFVAVNGVMYSVAAIVGEAAIEAAPEFEEFGRWGADPAASPDPVPATGGWRHREGTVERFDGTSSWSTIAVPGIVTDDPAVQTAFASWGDSAALVQWPTPVQIDGCEAPAELLRVRYTSDGGATWSESDLLQAYPEEYARLGSASSNVTLAVVDGLVAVKWVPAVALLSQCLVSGTEFAAEDVSRTSFEGVVLSPSSGRGGELVSWRDLGVDPQAAQAARRGAPETARITVIDGERTTEHRLDDGWLRVVEGAFAHSSLRIVDGPRTVRVDADGLTTLPEWMATVGGLSALVSRSLAVVEDRTMPGQVSIDGGRTFADSGLAANICLQQLVVIDGEWFASTIWTRSPDDVADDGALPESLPLLSRRDRAGNWSHRALAELAGVTDSAQVIGVADLRGRAAFLVLDGSGQLMFVEG